MVVLKCITVHNIWLVGFIQYKVLHNVEQTCFSGSVIHENINNQSVHDSLFHAVISALSSLTSAATSHSTNPPFSPGVPPFKSSPPQLDNTENRGR